MVVQILEHPRLPLSPKVIDLVVEDPFGKHRYLQVEVGPGVSARGSLCDLQLDGRLLMTPGGAVPDLHAGILATMIDSHHLFALRPAVAEAGQSLLSGCRSNAHHFPYSSDAFPLVLSGSLCSQSRLWAFPSSNHIHGRGARTGRDSSRPVSWACPRPYPSSPDLGSAQPSAVSEAPPLSQASHSPTDK